MTTTPPRRRSLEQLPQRTLALLHGLAKNPALRQIMATAGYTQRTHKQGFALLQAVASFEVDLPPALPSNPTADAVRAVSDWYTPSFDRIRAALEHLHPAEATYVLRGLVRAGGVPSVVAADVLLDRLEHLAGVSPDPRAKNPTSDDAKVMATLAERGFDAKELRRVRELLHVAHGLAPTGFVHVDPEDEEQRLVALKAWYDDWAATAHALIKKRGDLIKLGLAQRQSGKV